MTRKVIRQKPIAKMTTMADLIAFNGIWFFPVVLGQLGSCVPVKHIF